MTPEERAREFLYRWQTVLMPGPDRVQVDLQAVIDAAVAEEREACARVADTHVRSLLTGSPHWDNQVGHSEHPSRDPAYQIATAIRKRG